MHMVTRNRGGKAWGQKGKGGGKDNKHRPIFSSSTPLGTYVINPNFEQKLPKFIFLRQMLSES